MIWALDAGEVAHIQAPAPFLILVVLALAAAVLLDRTVFGRHLRAMLGLTATEFRRRFPFPVALARFQERLVRPYREQWRGFHPLVGRL